MICSHCHTPNPTNADVCSQCGSGLDLAGDVGLGATLEVSQSASIDTGTDFGPRYHVESLLGSGGMGKVYKARDRELDRTVAIKVLRPDLMTDPMAMQRFKHELLLASSISHPNILRIHDLGEYNGVKFISMAYVDGGDLTQLLRKEGRLPLERSLAIMRQLAAALGAAHGVNVVHRDLKPQNILLGGQDHVYVTDFGIAKTLESDRTSVTRTGAVLGTPLYMSPEQVEGKPVDHRSDLYTFGLILYEMLTGILPFSGDTTFQLMYQRVHQLPKRPETVIPDLPPYLSRICLKCLEKEPAKRYQSASEILVDLDQRHSPSQTRTVQITLPVISKKASLLSGAALVLLLAGLLALPPVRDFFFGHSKPTAPTSGIPSLQQGKFVAVLPMKIVGDQSLSYVADGLVESLSAKLFQLHDVHTTSAAEVQKARPSSSLNEAARQLGVNLIVSGAIHQGQGDKLGIIVSLDNVASGQRVWTEEFPGVQQDLLTLEDKIYTRLVEQLALKPSNEEMARATSHPTENIEAYDLYLKGRSAMRGQQDVKNVQGALGFYEQALKKDPNFAIAYAGVADASLVMYHEKKDSFWSQKALAAAQQAERLNDNLPEVHFALGSVYTASGKGAEAVSELQRALQLAPNSDDGYRGLGKAYLTLGQKDKALEAYQKAIELNPYYWVNYNYAGQAYSGLGEYDKALAAFQRITELEPDNAFGYLNVGAIYFQQGKYEQCIPFFQRALQIQPHYLTYSNLGTAFFFLKRYNESVPMFEKAVEINQNDPMLIGNLADAYRWSGQPDKAKTTYERAISLGFKQLQVNPRDANVLDQLSLYYAKKGDAVQAADFIRRARAINPADVSMMYDQAVVEALNGRTEDALKTLREALTKGYSVKEAQADPELAGLQAQPGFKKLVAEFSKLK